MLRLGLLFILTFMLFAVAGCSGKLPKSEDLLKLFEAAEESNHLSPSPTGVPKLNLRDIDDYRELCSQCHEGPAYDSDATLIWGHRESCIGTDACLSCHSSLVHEPGMKGRKQVCMDCHLEQNAPVNCADCHPADWCKEFEIHDPDYFDTHGEVGADAAECMECHAGQSWCFDCHQIDMPHPEDHVTEHAGPGFKMPKVCEKCHGEKNCKRCHDAEGVVLFEDLLN